MHRINCKKIIDYGIEEVPEVACQKKHYVRKFVCKTWTNQDVEIVFSGDKRKDLELTKGG